MNSVKLWIGSSLFMTGTFLISCQNMKTKEGAACIETLKVDSTSPSALMKKQLPGTWQSATGLNGETPLWTVTFNEDGTYESFLKPSTYKNGTWDIANDTSLFICVKDIDKFTILKLNDTLLHIRTEDQWHFQYELHRNKYIGYKQ